ncbi:MAG: hypothetical protein WC651_05420 [Candidatus Gracilibacteria bacterium]|jgi:hypothetical protein
MDMFNTPSSVPRYIKPERHSTPAGIALLIIAISGLTCDRVKETVPRVLPEIQLADPILDERLKCAVDTANSLCEEINPSDFELKKCPGSNGTKAENMIPAIDDILAKAGVQGSLTFKCTNIGHFRPTLEQHVPPNILKRGQGKAFRRESGHN